MPKLILHKNPLSYLDIRDSESLESDKKWEEDHKSYEYPAYFSLINEGFKKEVMDKAERCPYNILLLLSHYRPKKINIPNENQYDFIFSVGLQGVKTQEIEFKYSLSDAKTMQDKKEAMRAKESKYTLFTLFHRLGDENFNEDASFNDQHYKIIKTVMNAETWPYCNTKAGRMGRLSKEQVFADLFALYVLHPNQMPWTPNTPPEIIEQYQELYNKPVIRGNVTYKNVFDYWLRRSLKRKYHNL